MTSNQELRLGSLTEIWKNKTEWEKYFDFLQNMDPESIDSQGNPVKLSRFATFLRLYVDLYHREKYLREEINDPKANEILSQMVMEIKTHEEDFFGTERTLSCIDSGIRKQVLDNVKKVRRKEAEAGAWVYEPAYPPVLDKLNHLLGMYHEWTKKQELMVTSE